MSGDGYRPTAGGEANRDSLGMLCDDLRAENERLRALVEAHATVAALRVHACTAGAGQSVSRSGTVKSWNQPCPSCQRLSAARDILRASS